MVFETIRDLTESRLIRSKTHYKNYNLRDIADLTFLYFLAIQILKHEFEFAPKIDAYSKSTVSRGGFKLYSQSGNDLYQLLFILFNDLDQLDLKDSDANEILRKRLNPTESPIRLYLRSVGEKPNKSRDHRFLYDLETRLVIQESGYKNIRRLVEDWADLNNNQRSLALTRLLQAFRMRARRSELLPWLEDLAKRRRLELSGVCNPETGRGCDDRPNEPNLLTKAALYGAAAWAGVQAGKAFGKWHKG